MYSRAELHQILCWSLLFILNSKRVLVVSIGHSHDFYIVLVPLEYILSIPPHCTYAIVFCTYLSVRRLTFTMGQSALRHGLTWPAQ